LPGGGKGVPVLDVIMALKKYKQTRLELKEEPGLDKARSQESQCLYNLKKNNPDYESFKSLDMAKRRGYNCEVIVVKDRLRSSQQGVLTFQFEAFLPDFLVSINSKYIPNPYVYLRIRCNWELF
jgi:hypothetical protein